VFAKHDWLARNAWRGGQKKEELEALSVSIVLLNMQIDTSTRTASSCSTC